MIVGLCGYARVGKDSLCGAVGFQRAAFADALKADLAPLLARFDNPPKEIVRPLFVEYGRTVRRLDPDHWLKRLPEMAFGDWCVCDVRYPNEVSHLLNMGAIIIRVHRPGFGPANAEEKESIADIDARWPNLSRVTNSGTIEEAANKLRLIL